MERKLTLSFEQLRRICIDNNWFTAGSSTQYEKLFSLNDQGAGLEELALVIWLCSEGSSVSEIKGALTWEAMKAQNRPAPDETVSAVRDRKEEKAEEGEFIPDPATCQLLLGWSE